MELKEAQALILAEMRDKLTVTGWTFGWDNAVSSFGVAHYRTKTITMSRKLVLAGNRDQVLDTIRHEIAHANVGAGHHHDAVWKREAYRLGATPSRVAVDAPNIREQGAPWRGVCPNGHEGGSFWRKPRVQRSCSKCCPGKFNEAYLITYTHVDTKEFVR